MISLPLSVRCDDPRTLPNCRPVRSVKKAAKVWSATFSLALILIGGGAGILNYYELAQYLPRVPKLSKPSVAELVAPSINEAQAEDVVIAQVAAVLEGKYRDVEDALLDELAHECETRGQKEPNGTVILDTNNRFSFGRHQWQAESVQFYVEKLYKQKVDRRTAILIALDAYPAIPLNDLTRQVLFTEKDGWRNWTNCANKLSLPAQINVINKLR